MHNSKNNLSLIFLVLLLSISSVSAGTIDNFSDSPVWSMNPVLNQTLTRLDTGLGNNALGASRFTTLTHVEGINTFDINLGFIASSNNGYAIISSGSQAYGTASFLYDSNGQGLGVDFSNATSINVLYQADHLGYLKNSTMSFNITDEFNNTSTVSRVWATTVYLNQSQWFTEKFSLSEFAGVDLAHVKSILFYYEGDYANDMVLDSITATEQPRKSVPVMNDSLFILLAAFTLILGLYAINKYGR